MDEQSGDLIEHYKALTDELEEKNKVSTTKLLINFSMIKFTAFGVHFNRKRQPNEEIA